MKEWRKAFGDRFKSYLSTFLNGDIKEQDYGMS